jgi:hypothetical protein
MLLSICISRLLLLSDVLKEEGRTLFLLPKVKVEFRHLFSLQKRFSLCFSHKINANIVVVCWLVKIKKSKYNFSKIGKQHTYLVMWKYNCEPLWLLWMLIDLTYIQNISVKRIRYGFSTRFYDKNYLPVSYSNIIISKTHFIRWTGTASLIYPVIKSVPKTKCLIFCLSVIYN